MLDHAGAVAKFYIHGSELQKALVLIQTIFLAF